MAINESKQRLDVLLFEKGLAPSRHRASALVMAGNVIVDGVKIDKPGKAVSRTAALLLRERLPYVSRGGIKLGAALVAFGLDPKGLIVLDAGASTGGFTDCLLTRGAARVICVDVGYGQLDWKIRTDARVTVMERTNIRYSDVKTFPCPVNAAVADLSFISLKLVLPKFREIVPQRGWLVPLVKPQFEAGRAHVGKGGVVRDREIIMEAVQGVKNAAEDNGFEVISQMESPIRGPRGNREFFLYLRRI